MNAEDFIVVTSGDAMAMAFPFSAKNDVMPKAASSTEGTADGNPVPVVEQQDQTSKFILWGNDNLWPHKAWNDIKANSVAPIAVGLKTDALISGGFVYGARYMKDGQEVFEQVLIDEIERFKEDSCLETLYLPTAAHNLNVYRSFFPKFAFNRKKLGERKINELYCEDSQFHRMGQQNRNGHITSVYRSTKFGEADLNPSDLKAFSAVDRHGNIMKQIKEASSQIYYPMFKRINGNIAYEFPRWEGVRESKWLDLAKHIPIWKAALMAQSASLKWMFIIHPKFWEKQYSDWEKKTPDDQGKLKKAHIKLVLDSISGSDKAGKAVFTETIYDEESRKMVPMFEIKRLDTSKQGGDYIEDSQEADAHIVRAFEVPISVIGQTPGAKMGAGSGSDARVHWNQFMIRHKSEQDAIMEPIKVIGRYNNWAELVKKAVKGKPEGFVGFEAQLKNYHIATLSSGVEVLASDKSNANGDKTKKDGQAAG